MLILGPRTAISLPLRLKWMHADTLRVGQALSTEGANLSTSIVNWSTWNDTHRCVQRPTRTYETSNLVPSSFEAGRISLMLFLNARGQVVTAHAMT